MKIREVALDDASRICKIYNYYIEHTVITFETAPISVEEMAGRIQDIIESGAPYYVGETEEGIVGYCYLNKWNGRSAFSTTKEITIYLDIHQTGKGYGSMLYSHLLQNIDKKRIHVLIAGICIPNDESVKLHEKFGFKQASFMKEVGWKFDQWRDLGHWLLHLNE